MTDDRLCVSILLNILLNYSILYHSHFVRTWYPLRHQPLSLYWSLSPFHFLSRPPYSLAPPTPFRPINPSPPFITSLLYQLPYHALLTCWSVGWGVSCNRHRSVHSSHQSGSSWFSRPDHRTASVCPWSPPRLQDRRFCRCASVTKKPTQHSYSL